MTQGNRAGLHTRDISASEAVSGLRAYWSIRLEEAAAQHRAGVGGVHVSQLIAGAAETVVLTAYRRAQPSGPQRHALVAVGGFGRAEMGPRSDIDLLFLFARDRDRDAGLISGVLGPLWDLHFDVGYASRTVPEAVQFCREDTDSCTAMMDSRFLGGDHALFEAFQRRLFRRLPKSLIRTLHRWRVRRTDDRGSVQLLEPNVKESPGGLRDIQALEWALQIRGGSPEVEALRQEQLSQQDWAQMQRGRDFLWRIRHQLHWTTGRKRDVLEHDIKPVIARELGYQAVDPVVAAEKFMRDYYEYARSVYQLTELAFERLTRRPRNAHRIIVLEQGVHAVDGELVLDEGSAWFSADPVRLLRVFLLAQIRNLKLSQETQQSVRGHLHLIDDTVRAAVDARDVFLRVLKRKTRVAQTLRSMHALGVLGAYLPEFEAVTCLVQHDVYHIYTVDEHTLVAVDNLEALLQTGARGPLPRVMRGFFRRDLLYMSVLLHDVGKAAGEDHVSSGVELTRRLGHRLQLAVADCAYLCFQVQHHQDMVILSQRRDLDDARMIAGFAAQFPDSAWLQGLYLLSYADLSAVSPDAWSDWQGALLWELYEKTAQQLESGVKALEQEEYRRHLLAQRLKELRGSWSALRVEAFREHVEMLPPGYLTAYEPDKIDWHLRLIERLREGGLFAWEFIQRARSTELLVCTRDQRQLLAKICGALAVNDVDILRADVHTRDDSLVVDVFQVVDIDGSPALPEWKQERVIQRLDEVIGLKLKARELLKRYSAHWQRRKQKQNTHVLPATITIENQISDRYTVLDVEAEDGVGLLYDITHCVSELGLNIHMAIVNTVARRARDSFYVVDARGEKIVNFHFLQETRHQLLDLLS